MFKWCTNECSRARISFDSILLLQLSSFHRLMLFILFEVIHFVPYHKEMTSFMVCDSFGCFSAKQTHRIHTSSFVKLTLASNLFSLLCTFFDLTEECIYECMWSCDLMMLSSFPWIQPI